MDIHTLTNFLMWCTIINGGLLIFWAVMLLAVPNFVYRSQRRFFPGSQEQFQLAMYGFLGLFKTFVLIFNFVPWMALLIIR